MATKRSHWQQAPSKNGEAEQGIAPIEEEEGAEIPPPRSQSHRDRRVFIIRSLLILVLVTAMTVVATFAGVYVYRDEHADFQLQYHDAVLNLGYEFQYHLDLKRDSLTTFSSKIASRYGHLGVWPNVTIPHFHEQTEALLRVAEGEALSFNPVIIQDVNRLQWEAHATESVWIIEGKDSVLIVPDPNTIWPDNRTVSFGIYSRDDDGDVIYDPGYQSKSVNYSDVLVPVWQIAPFEGNEDQVMYNLHSEVHMMEALDNMMTYAVPTLTGILKDGQGEGHVTGPNSIIFYPVLDNLTSDRVVGSVSLVFSWNRLFAMIVPEYIKGIVCVLSASNGQVYSYNVSGDDVFFMGEGDMHDPKYDEEEEVVEARLLYEGEDDAGKFITYTLRMYPSDLFREQYITNKPAIYAVCTLLIFLFTAGLFCLYDHLVEDRQQETSRIATQRGNIVESMFPAAFLDRLYEVHGNVEAQQTKHTRRKSSDGEGSASESQSNSQTESRTESHSESHASGSVTGTVTRRSSSGLSSMGENIKLRQIEKVMKGLTGTNRLDPRLSLQQGVLGDEPIAELFHNTSIMFSDIVGFTKWSSERSPNEVFKLLEQIFWEFDEIAASLNVFKLGTIGDCYIAVTGIPKPVKDHAVLLTQFAFDARDKVREVCARLEAEGLDTAKLDMRFGIHSGDTTAGILRGAKSRFELFGDTINTASRMESTGLPGKIQVSEETAMLIQGDSKSQWLTKRDTLVAAKGKGELQTYWAEPHRRVSVSDHVDSSNLERGLLRGSSLRCSFLLRNSLEQCSESGESLEKNGPDSTGSSRRSSVDLEEVTIEDVGDEKDIATHDSSELDPDSVELMSKKVGDEKN